ncbi:MAG: nucleoside-diphosphate kinase [bacterium]|nr:nucleoside-diphosphate kinase [bacterium]
MERTVILMKPDALQRGLIGELLLRFERKGLQIIGLKMMSISDLQVEEHYAHHKDKPFFGGLKQFMQSAPVVAVALQGVDAIEAVRIIVGPTKGRVAPAGTIRGDFAMSMQENLVHASDSVETAAAELTRFFAMDDLHAYERADLAWIYAEDERS